MKLLIDNARANGHDCIVGEGYAVDHHFKTIVVCRIMTGGYHNAAVGIRHMEGRKIQYRCGRYTDINYVAAGTEDAVNQRFSKSFTVSASIARDNNTGIALIQDFATQRLSDLLSQLDGELRTNYAADIVSAKNLTGDINR